MAQSKEFPQYRWSTPKSWTSGRKAGQPSVIFIHTTEGSEGRASAEDGAAYDARRTDGTSTHFFVDQDSTVQEVLTSDEAHAARSHGNDVGIQIEVCGKAGQSVAQWADAASAGAIEQCARLCVALRKKYGKTRFPLVNLTPAQLRAGQHGFAEHKDATLAWAADGGTHEDPGPNFPWSKLFARIKQIEAPIPAPPKPPVEDEVKPEDITAIAKAVVNYKVDVDTTAKGTNMQPIGSVIAYGSSEHHQAIDAARSAEAKVTALALKVDNLQASLDAVAENLAKLIGAGPTA
jgi:N-acetyl-anhydromuramyl-L-alanine amidase AmpD